MENSSIEDMDGQEGARGYIYQGRKECLMFPTINLRETGINLHRIMDKRGLTPILMELEI